MEKKTLTTVLAMALTAVVAVVVLTACATGGGKIKFPYYGDHLENGEYAQARELLSQQRSNKFSEYNLNNEISYTLDRGMLAYYAGEHTISNQDLFEAERLMEEALTKSVTERVKRVSKNDPYKIEYVGEDYENIYLNVFTALNFYKQGSIESAQVEIRKMNDKMKFTVDTYEAWLASVAPNWKQQTAGAPTYYYKSALAGYFGMLFWRAGGNRDSARIDAQSISDAFTQMPEVYSHPLPKELTMRKELNDELVNDELSIPQGMARLNFISFTGLTPLKTGTDKSPRLLIRRSETDRIEIAFDNGSKMNLSLLEPVTNVVYQIARTREFYRTTGEEILRKAGEFKQDAEFFGNVGVNAALSLFMPLLATKVVIETLAGRANEATGEYDTMDRTVDRRMGRFIPGRAYVGGINLKPGAYTFTINYYKGTDIIQSRKIENYRVDEGRLNLIDDYCLKYEIIRDDLYYINLNDEAKFLTGTHVVENFKGDPLPDYPGRLPAPQNITLDFEKKEEMEWRNTGDWRTSGWKGTGRYYMGGDMSWDPVPGAIMYYVFCRSRHHDGKLFDIYKLQEKTMETKCYGHDSNSASYKIVAFGNEGYGKIATVIFSEMLKK